MESLAHYPLTVVAYLLDGALIVITESITELRYYREAVFVPPPGPESEQLKEIAAKHRVG